MSVKEDTHRNELLNSTKLEFRNAGYTLSDNDISSSSFDFIVKKKEIQTPLIPKKMIIRVLAELDLFKRHTSQELQLIAKLIQGKPLLIAKFSTGKRIKPATLYRRHNVPAISLQTLKSFLQDELSKKSPQITKLTKRGGIFVNLSTSRFVERRKQLELDISLLAEKIGVSRQSLYKYERGKSSPKLDSYARIFEIMGIDLEQPINIFEKPKKSTDDLDFTIKELCKPKSQRQKEITGYLQEKEIQILWLRQEPVDGIIVNEQREIIDKSEINPGTTIITGVSSTNEEKDHDRLLLLNKLARFLGKKAIWFEDEESDKESKFIKTTDFFTILTISDLEHMGNEELLKSLKLSDTSPQTKSKR